MLTLDEYGRTHRSTPLGKRLRVLFDTMKYDDAIAQAYYEYPAEMALHMQVVRDFVEFGQPSRARPPLNPGVVNGGSFSLTDSERAVARAYNGELQRKTRGFDFRHPCTGTIIEAKTHTLTPNQYLEAEMELQNGRAVVIAAVDGSRVFHFHLDRITEVDRIDAPLED